MPPGDEVRSIIDSMDDLQQRLRGSQARETRETPENVEHAKRTLLGKAASPFAFGRTQTEAIPPKKSDDQRYLEELLSDADRAVAMLAGIN